MWDTAQLAGWWQGDTLSDGNAPHLLHCSSCPRGPAHPQERSHPHHTGQGPHGSAAGSPGTGWALPTCPGASCSLRPLLGSAPQVTCFDGRHAAGMDYLPGKSSFRCGLCSHQTIPSRDSLDRHLICPSPRGLGLGGQAPGGPWMAVHSYKQQRASQGRSMKPLDSESGRQAFRGIGFAHTVSSCCISVSGQRAGPCLVVSQGGSTVQRTAVRAGEGGT